MRILSCLALILISTLVSAEEIKSCFEPTSIKVSMDSDTIKMTSIRGEEAEEIFNSMKEGEQPPKEGTFDLDYLTKAQITAKYSDRKTCWKIRVPSYTVDGEYLGLSGCYSYSCNISEWK